MGWLHRHSVVLTLAVFLHGCASQATLPYASSLGADRGIPRDIIVTAARFQPEANLDLLLRSKAEVTRAGAGEGALQGAGVALQGAGKCGDPLCAAAFLLLSPVFMGVGAVVGAVRDAPSAAPPETIQSGQQAMQEGIARLALQRSMQDVIAQELRARNVTSTATEELTWGPSKPEASPRYEALDPQHAVLEVSVLVFQFKKAERQDKKLSYRLSMKTRVRLLAPQDRALLDEMQYLHESESHTATEWLSDDARLFQAALGEAIRHTSRIVVHDMFLLYVPATPAAPASAAKPPVPEYVLRPVYPQPVISFSLRGHKTMLGLRFVPVDDLQPTLSWEAFPRAVDVASAGGHAGRFGDVRYEIVVYDVKQPWRVDLESSPHVYRRTDLDNPSHRLETALQPCERYFWTVRAHFRLDGWPRVTEWMGAYDAFPPIKPWKYRRGQKTGPVSGLLELPPQLMFLPFRAPAADGKACD